jgi:hypothetical protein
MKTQFILLSVGLLFFSCEKESEQIKPNFNFPSFNATDAGQINLAGKALFEDSRLVLNKATTPGMGYAYYNKMVDVIDGFETSFSFTISDLGGITDDEGNTGGDGIAFSLFNSDTTIFKTNDKWFSGIANSLSIEFDTFNNGIANDDPNGNHIVLYAIGENTGEAENMTMLSLSSSVPDFSSAGTHVVKLVYQNNTLTVYLDGVSVLSESIDLPTQVQLDNGRAYIGFSSFSGMATENQIINSWEFKAY